MKISLVIRVASGLMVLAVLLGCGFWLVRIAGELPLAQRLVSITVSVDASPVVIGRAALVQPPDGPTGEQHLALLREGGGIVAYDIDPVRRLGYRAHSVYSDTGRLEIPEGASVLTTGGQRWGLERRGNRLEMRGNGTEAMMTPTGLTLSRDGETLVQAVGLWTRAGALVRQVSRRFPLGGAVEAADLPAAVARGAIPDPALPPEALWLVHESGSSPGAGRWFVANGRSAGGLEIAGRLVDIEGHPVPLVAADGTLLAEALIIGRTEYRLAYAGGRLSLTPVSRFAWVAPEAVETTPGALVSAPAPRLDVTALWQAGALLGGITLAATLTSLATAQTGAGAGLAAAGLGFATLPLPLPALALAGLGAALAVTALAALALYALQGWRRAAALGLLALGAGLIFAATLLPGEAALEPRLAGAGAALLAPVLVRGLSASGGLFWLWTCAVAAPGAVAATRLAQLEPTERYQILLDRHLLALAAVGLSAALVVTYAASPGLPALRRALLPTGRHRARALSFTALGLVLLALTLIGNETGFFGLFQPSELAKTVLVLLVAATLTGDLARRSMLSAAEGALALGPPIAAIALAVAILVASAVNYDMSPILVCTIAVLAALLAGSALHAQQLGLRGSARTSGGLPIPHARRRFSLWLARRWIARHSSLWPPVLLGAVFTALAGLSLWLARHPTFREGAAFDTMRYLLTPWLRAQSWHDMALTNPDRLIDFPEAGTQLLRAREALAAAQCRLGDWLCPPGLPQTAPQGVDALLLRVPAVQDDFAAVSLVHAMGYDGALLYMAAQAGLVATALTIGLTALLSRAEFRLGNWLAGCATIGMAALVGAQMLIAWGNVLGWLPIMGQPMTFASFGASHHLAVALPFAAVTLAAASLGTRPDDAARQARASLFRQRLR